MVEFPTPLTIHVFSLNKCTGNIVIIVKRNDKILSLATVLRYCRACSENRCIKRSYIGKSTHPQTSGHSRFTKLPPLFGGKATVLSFAYSKPGILHTASVAKAKQYVRSPIPSKAGGRNLSEQYAVRTISGRWSDRQP